MGLDRFDYEEYSCGDYETLKEAEQVKRAQEADAKQRCSPGIEDRYWIDTQQECKLCGWEGFGTPAIMKHAVEKHPDIIAEVNAERELEEKA